MARVRRNPFASILEEPQSQQSAPPLDYAPKGASRSILKSLDEIAAILPYDRYVSAETVLRMRLGSGERAAMFRGSATSNAITADLRRAQAEAEMLCF